MVALIIAVARLMRRYHSIGKVVTSGALEIITLMVICLQYALFWGKSSTLVI